MNTSYNWMKRYIPDLNVTPKEYLDGMTLSGTKTEYYTELDKNLDKIVVGQIRKIERHPDADKLVVCQVDIGERTIQIVTGAPNAFEGAKVAVVLDGGKVAGDHSGHMPEDGIVIKAGALRGVPSEGMMCSIEEMGSDRNYYPEAPENGIYVFEDDVEVGSDAIEALGLHDVVFEYEITSNRVDCYSVIGIAREAAATFGYEFKAPEVKATGNDEDVNDYITLDIQDPELCPRYCARVVKNVKIGPSPKWMQRALSSSGIRPINNLVDITNFVMEEYGQPMHAFDLDTVAGRKIVVRRAEDGEKFTTLDGQEREMDHDVLMICDAEKSIGIAGIMGGENSMITGEVHTVLFESANFNGTNVRLSAKRIGLRTDASGKFEKGLDPNNAEAAINRACELMEELGAGEVVGGMADFYPNPVPKARIKFEPDKINDLLGTSLTKEEMIDYLAKVELHYDGFSDEIIAPTFRQDIKCTADLAEEVARFFGYDNIPVTLPSGEATTGKLPYDMRIEELARNVAEFNGFSQAYCYSFESPKVFDRLLLAEDAKERDAITISNPLGEDFSIMRTMSENGMLVSLAFNYNQRNKDVRLYELGNIYIPHELPLKDLPDERMMFTLGMYGSGDFFDMKGVIEDFFMKAGMNERPEYENEAGKPYLHPGRQALIRYRDTEVGYLGELHPAVAKTYGIGGRAVIAVLDMKNICPLTTFDRKYTGIARFPAVTRDLSMVVPKEIPAGTIEKMIRQRGGKLLESVTLFDIYEGEQIEEGYKSMAYKFVLRSPEKTLDEKDITSVMNKIMNGLESLNIQLRQ